MPPSSKDCPLQGVFKLNYPHKTCLVDPDYLCPNKIDYETQIGSLLKLFTLSIT